MFAFFFCLCPSCMHCALIKLAYVEVMAGYLSTVYQEGLGLGLGLGLVYGRVTQHSELFLYQEGLGG